MLSPPACVCWLPPPPPQPSPSPARPDECHAERIERPRRGGGRHPRVSERRNGLLFARQHRRRFISFMNHTVGKLNNDASDLVDRRENDKKKTNRTHRMAHVRYHWQPSIAADIPGMAMLAPTVTGIPSQDLPHTHARTHTQLKICHIFD